MPRILIVDDDVGTRETFAAILRRARFDVVLAASGQEALAATDRSGVDVMLLDLRLPDCDGIDVLRSLRERGNCIPVVVITAFGSIQSAIEATRLGVIEYLEKPLLDDHIIVTVQNALAAKPSQAAEPLSVPVSRAVHHWAALIAQLTGSLEDPHSVMDWARYARLTVTAIRTGCAAVGVSAKVSLDFARGLRAVCIAQRTACHPEALLDMDPRTMRRIFGRSYRLGSKAAYPSVRQFMAEQALIHDDALLRTVEAHLEKLSDSKKT